MSEWDQANQEPLVARVVHKSSIVEHDQTAAVHKLMLNLLPEGRTFEPGTDIAIMPPDAQAIEIPRRYTIEAVGEVPFEASIDITLYVREPGGPTAHPAAHYLLQRALGDEVTLHGPLTDPFHPPLGSRSNMILIGAGTGMVPFRWLARKIQALQLDWMGKVLMLEGAETGTENLYQNRPLLDADQYFDEASRRAFEALKTRYSAVAYDAGPSPAAYREAMWRLMGQGKVTVYLAGYRVVAEALDEAMAGHLRLPGRWEDAKATLKKTGRWREFLYD